MTDKLEIVILELNKIKGKLEDAKKMLEKGMNINIVTEITGLTEEEILENK